MKRLFLTGLMLAVIAVAGAQAEIKPLQGMTKPWRDATISATLTGRVAAVFYKEGAFVKQGDVILELEKDEQELETARRKLLAESKAELTAAEHQAEIKKRDYEATKQIFDTTHSVSEEELWKKDLEAKLAVGELERLRAAEEKEVLEYQIAAAQLKQRQIIAPFNGQVVKINPEIGESCDVRDPLVRVVDASRCRFITYAPATLATGLTVGKVVTLKLDGGKSRSGVVEYVSAVADTSSGLVEIKIVFENADGSIKPGVTGSLALDYAKTNTLPKVTK